MKKLALLFIVTISFIGFVPSDGGRRSSPLFSLLKGVRDGENGGTACFACGVLLGLVDQLVEIHNVSIADAMSMFCDFLPKGGLRDACTILVKEFGPAVVALAAEDVTSDMICHAMGICTETTGEYCHLYPMHISVQELDVQLMWARKTALYARGRPFKFPDLCNVSSIKPICEIIYRFGYENLPVEDLDSDFYSRTVTLRGTSWRGKDCDDLSSNFHAGRKAADDTDLDTNCNGIMGKDALTGKTFEELWCDGTEQMGIVGLGDSFTAHFRIPQEWATAADLNETILQDVPFALENEFDWPMLSTTTGYKNSTWDVIRGPVDSFYLRLREINRCNHRDYQNIGVNGDNSEQMSKQTMYTLARNKSTDHPVLVSLALLGNDVCFADHTTDVMTTPEEFYANQLKILRYLDDTLPAGSKVITLGLIDGRFLYKTMHDRIHPLGAWRKDVTYSAFYDYFNCLYISPCFGWMNTNATWRNRTAVRARELSDTLKAVVTNNSFTNIKAHYFDFPMDIIVDRWVAEGGEPWQLIQPVDGLHPSQEAVALSTDVLWELLKKEAPDFIPPVNPNNDKIVKKFKDQGGY